MVLLRAIIRPEKVDDVLVALLDAGHTSVTKMDVYGRGKQKGIKIGEVFYDELPKVMLLMVIEDDVKDEIVKIIFDSAKTGEHGNFGDGRIFITPVDKAYTISSMSEGL